MTTGHGHWPQGVEPVRADLSQPASVGAAAEGCESVFLYVQGDAIATVNQLRAAGAQHITVLSTIDAANDSCRTEMLSASPFPIRNRHRSTRGTSRVAVMALTTRRLDGQRPVLTGPQSLTQREQVATLSRILQRPIQIETVSVDAARSWMSKRIPERYVELLLGQWEEETHTPARVTSEVERITGRAASSYPEALARTLTESGSTRRDPH